MRRLPPSRQPRTDVARVTSGGGQEETPAPSASHSPRPVSSSAYPVYGTDDLNCSWAVWPVWPVWLWGSSRGGTETRQPHPPASPAARFQRWLSKEVFRKVCWHA